MRHVRVIYKPTRSCAQQPQHMNNDTSTSSTRTSSSANQTTDLVMPSLAFDPAAPFCKRIFSFRRVRQAQLWPVIERPAERKQFQRLLALSSTCQRQTLLSKCAVWERALASSAHRRCPVHISRPPMTRPVRPLPPLQWMATTLRLSSFIHLAAASQA